MIIVYGGTFNPPTLGHEKIVSKIIKKFSPTKFIILPVGDNYTWKNNFVSFEHRKNMLELIFKDQRITISSLENEETFQGTYHALNQIKEEYQNEVYFLLGADNLNYLDEWLNYKKLVSEFRFIVLPRKGYDINEIILNKFKSFKDHFTVFDFYLDVSASMFRNNPKNNKDINPKIYQYIVKHELYEVNHYEV